MLRKVYVNLALKLLRQKKLSLLSRISSQYILLNVSRLITKPLCGPIFGILLVTYRCNQRCFYCDLPDIAKSCSDNSRHEADTAEFCRIIDEMADLGVKAIVFTGGEPLLRKDICELIAYANKLGMMTHLSSNGILIDEPAAVRLIESGLDSISISLDGATAEIHERARKSPGGFARSHDAIGLLVTQRKKLHATIRIKILTVVSKENIDDIPNILETGKRLGVDGVELMPCQPLLAGSHGERFSYDAGFVDRVDHMVKMLLADEDLRSCIDNSITHLKLFRNSFAGEPFPLKCHAGTASIVVDCYGDIYPCHPWANWRHQPLQRKGRSLSELWKSAEYSRIRKHTRDCGRCYLNCQSELSIMLDLFSGKGLGKKISSANQTHN